MAPMDGLELARKLKEIDPEVIVIRVSGHASMDNAMTSMKMGTFDHLTKPFKIDQLMSAISRASKRISTQQNDPSGGSADALLCNSKAVETLEEAVGHVFKSSSPLLLKDKIRKNNSAHREFTKFTLAKETMLLSSLSIAMRTMQTPFANS